MSEKVLLRFEDISADLTDISQYVADGGYQATRKAICDFSLAVL